MATRDFPKDYKGTWVPFERHWDLQAENQRLRAALVEIAQGRFPAYASEIAQKALTPDKRTGE